ncbi:hypothetical protein H7F15_17975 [Pontibacter sp. Tf4]|uniref:hypothetical protein n=1 Tax=Pontibacter sp. Tf4 TaxID=2761620 RepID=UPI001625C861|nr:hypothetical protein [Pontibacter sp. Tf4]MBB6612934.1 hypothetical protein [Pontibacter sp. Tf4]
MVLIADSGSTKTDWNILTATNVLEHVQTIGFNPMYQDAEEIYSELEKTLLPQLTHKAPAAIYFYGAGCSSPERNKRVSDALQRLFPESEVHIDHDLLSAARAACGHNPGIACILGTGSNSCLYDGSKITDNVPSLGFLLGDEGSGAYMGKLLLRAYFYRELPDELAQSLKNTYHLSKDTFLDTLYGADVPSRYIATFARFMHDKRKHPVIKEMIYENFELFFERHVLKYKDHTKLPVNFVGSIAYYFADILKSAARKYGLHVGTIIQSPSEGLISYHQQLLQKSGTASNA